MANNFKIDGKQYDSKKSHYVVEKQHEIKQSADIKRLEEKLEKHQHLPMDKAHQK
jgi:hypothetical protein